MSIEVSSTDDLMLTIPFLKAIAYPADRSKLLSCSNSWMVWLWQTCVGAARVLLKEYSIQELMFSCGLLTEKSHE